MMGLVKSEALEASHYWSSSRIIMQCPYCKTYNTVILGDLKDLSRMDVEACQCFKCTEKFWLPGWKSMNQDANGFWEEDPDGSTLTTDELGLEPGEDLIEHAIFEKGLERLLKD